MLTRAWREIGASRESMSVHANCDLRRRVVPPLPQELVGCFIYWVDLRYRLSGREPFWELARRCTRDMQRRIRHCGMPPTIIATQRLWLNRAAEMMMRRSANNARGGRTDTIGISNLGRISGLHDNEAVRIRGMHTLTSQHAFGVCMALFGLTLANRLSLSFLHPVPVISSLRAERFADAIVTILQTIVADTAIDVRRLAD